MEHTKGTILLGIDGTGPTWPSTYNHLMGQSFVRYITTHAPTRDRMYLRGPAVDALDIVWIADDGYRYVRLCRTAKPDARVLLTGYSRGCSAVIDVAVRLSRDNVTVDGMMLFDAVDRSPFPSLVFSGYDIPTNVLRVVHAKRDPHSVSRPSFGNSATTWHAPTKYESKEFWATHSGLGGVLVRDDLQLSGPFIKEGAPEFGFASFVTPAEDTLGARLVWQWAYPRLQSMGFLE